MSKNTFDKIKQFVKQIPKGKVATYGQIAKHLGINDARIVGWAMHANNNPSVPCHRVVNKLGEVAQNYAFDGWQEQRKRLEEEGITFIGKRQVNLDKHLLKLE